MFRVRRLIYLLFFIATYSNLWSEPFLVKNYPFGSSANGSSSNGNNLREQSQNEAKYEFLGYFTQNEITSFILTDITSKKTIWLPRDNAKTSVRIITWDPSLKELTISANGKNQELRISQNNNRLITPSLITGTAEASPAPSPAKRLRRPRRQLQ